MVRFSERLKADLTLLLVTVFWGMAFAVFRIVPEHRVVHYLHDLRLLQGAAVLFPNASPYYPVDGAGSLFRCWFADDRSRDEHRWQRRFHHKLVR